MSSLTMRSGVAIFCSRINAEAQAKVLEALAALGDGSPEMAEALRQWGRDTINYASFATDTLPHITPRPDLKRCKGSSGGLEEFGHAPANRKEKRWALLMINLGAGVRCFGDPSGTVILSFYRLSEVQWRAFCALTWIDFTDPARSDSPVARVILDITASGDTEDQDSDGADDNETVASLFSTPIGA